MVCLRTTRSTLSDCTTFKSCVLASVASIFGVLFVLYFHLSAMVTSSDIYSTLAALFCLAPALHLAGGFSAQTCLGAFVGFCFFFGIVLFHACVRPNFCVMQDTLMMLRHSRLYASKARLSSNGGCKMGCTYLSMRLHGLVDRESAEVAGGSWKAWLGSSLCIVEAVVPPHCGARRDMSNEFRICL